MRKAAAILLCAPMLAACSGRLGESLGSIYVDPGKYAYYDCAQLAAPMPGLKAREAELQSLIARADRGTGGSVIAAATYQPELNSVHNDMQLIAQARRTKQCDKPDADTPAANKPPAAQG